MTTYDNIVAQHRLLTEELGVERLRLVSSWSMGAGRRYAWAALHPEMVGRPRRSRARPGRRTTTRSSSPATSGRSPAIRTSTAASTRPSRRWRHARRSPPSTRAGASLSPSTARRSAVLRCRHPEQFIEIFWDAFSRSATPTTCSRRCGPGGTPTSATTRASAATSIRPSEHPGPHDHRQGGPTVLPAGGQRVRGSRSPARSPRDPDVWGHLAPFNPEDQAFIDRAISELLEE